MNIKWNEYTWYSKLAAVIFFIGVLPVWTFYIGMQYEETRQSVNSPSSFFVPVVKGSPVIDNPGKVILPDLKAISIASSTKSGWQVLSDSNYHYSVSYPSALIFDKKGFDAKGSDQVQYNDALTNILLSPIVSSVLFRDPVSTSTTIDNANVFVAIASGQCKFENGLSSNNGTAMVNGRQYFVSDLSDAAGPDEMGGAMYSTNAGGNCISLGWYGSGGIPSMLYSDQPALAAKFDDRNSVYTDKLEVVFGQMLDSFSVDSVATDLQTYISMKDSFTYQYSKTLYTRDGYFLTNIENKSQLDLGKDIAGIHISKQKFTLTQQEYLDSVQRNKVIIGEPGPVQAKVQKIADGIYQITYDVGGDIVIFKNTIAYIISYDKSYETAALEISKTFTSTS